MSSYYCEFKIVLLGDQSVGKGAFTKRYCYNIYDPKESMTIGVDFLVKSVEVRGKKIKLQIWDVGGEERFRFLLPTYCIGANGAFILYDITKPQTLDNINEWTTIVRRKGGNIPIMLVGTNLDLAETQRQVQREYGIQLAEKNKLDSFAEISAKTGQNINKAFEVMTQLMLKRTESKFKLNKSEKKKRSKQQDIKNVAKNLVWNKSVHNAPKLSHTLAKEINQYITLKLENGRTFIYVNEIRFIQCIRLGLNIQKEDIPLYDEIESIDEAANVYKNHIYQNTIVRGPMAAPVRDQSHDITPEQEFWGHCSNLQAWVENDYDTRILMSNISFPLLRVLSKAGDPKARKVYKEEIALRLETGYPSVVQYLLEQGFFREFSRDEFKTILESTDLIQKLSSNSKVLSSLLNNILQKFPTMTESIILQILNLPNREDIVLSIINSFLFTTKKSFADFCDLNPFDVAIVTLFDEKLFDFLTLEEQKDIIQKIHKRDLFLFIEKFSRNYAHPRSSTIKISKQTYSYVYLIILRAIRGTPLMDDLLMKISHRIGVIGPMLKAIQELRKTDEIYWTNIFASFLKLWGEIKEKELLSFVSKDTLPKLVSKKTIEILTASLGVLKEDELIEELEKEIKKDRCDKCGEALPLEALRILILKKVVYCPTCGTLIRKIPRFLI